MKGTGKRIQRLQQNIVDLFLGSPRCSRQMKTSRCMGVNRHTRSTAAITTTKMKPFWFITWKLLFSRGDSLLVEAIKIWRGVYLGDFFQMGGMIKFLKDIVQKHTQANLQSLLSGWQATAGIIGKYFKRHLLSIKKYISFKYERYEIQQIKLIIKDNRAYYCSLDLAKTRWAHSNSMSFFIQKRDRG